jgi:hypothetical protein
VYTGNDKFAAGDTIELAKVNAPSESGTVRAFVDYVCLSDGTVWGDAVTEQAKEVAARFKK